MTYQEAMEEMKSERSLYESEIVYPFDGTPDGYLLGAFDMTITALKKQIPCKPAPKKSNKAEIPVCGKCGGVMDLEQGELNYCPNCGQAIDWSDKSDKK